MNEIQIKALSTYTYVQYRELINSLYKKNQTTGPIQSQAYLDYTKMNITRMNRLDKTASISNELSKLLKNTQPQNWIILTEGWCGDAAQNIPYIEKLSQIAPQINTYYVLRDENLELMERYLTNGSRSIPKLIAFDENGEELFNWGPRPESIQKHYLDERAKGRVYAEISTEIHTMYSRDKGAELQREYIDLLNTK